MLVLIRRRVDLMLQLSGDSCIYQKRHLSQKGRKKKKEYVMLLYRFRPRVEGKCPVVPILSERS